MPDEPVTLDGDAVRLTQVLVNLLNNATKLLAFLAAANQPTDWWVEQNVSA